MLFSASRPAAGVTLELLRQGLDLPEDQQAFFFQRDLLFQRIAAAREIARRIVQSPGVHRRRTADRAYPPRAGRGSFRVFNRFFPLAERLQVEIVLVFVFILFPAQRQGGVKFYLLRLRLLDAVGVLAQTLAQR